MSEGVGGNSAVDTMVSASADPQTPEQALTDSASKVSKAQRPSLIPKQEKRGWLQKANKDGKYWKKRWFMLKGNTLGYYASDSSEKAKGEFILTGRTVRRFKDAKHHFAFEIT